MSRPSRWEAGFTLGSVGGYPVVVEPFSAFIVFSIGASGSSLGGIGFAVGSMLILQICCGLVAMGLDVDRARLRWLRARYSGMDVEELERIRDMKSASAGSAFVLGLCGPVLALGLAWAGRNGWFGSSANLGEIVFRVNIFLALVATVPITSLFDGRLLLGSVWNVITGGRLDTARGPEHHWNQMHRLHELIRGGIVPVEREF